MRSIRTCETNKEVVSELTAKLGAGPENLIARVALAYSLSREKQLNLKDIRDSRGKEYSAAVLFGNYEDLYVALVCQRYGLHKADPDVPKYLKMHIDDGLKVLADTVHASPNLSLMDLIIQEISSGISCLA